MTKENSDTFMVEDVLYNDRSHWAKIGGDNGLTYKLKVKGEQELPKLFSTIRVSYWIPTLKNGSIKRRIIKTWSLFTDDIASNEPDTLFDEGE